MPVMTKRPPAPAPSATMAPGMEDLWVMMEATAIRLRAKFLGFDLDDPDRRDDWLAWLEAGAPVADKERYLAWLEAIDPDGSVAAS